MTCPPQLDESRARDAFGHVARARDREVVEFAVCEQRGRLDGRQHVAHVDLLVHVVQRLENAGTSGPPVVIGERAALLAELLRDGSDGLVAGPEQLEVVFELPPVLLFCETPGVVRSPHPSRKAC
jgi:hypothetical protein